MKKNVVIVLVFIVLSLLAANVYSAQIDLNDEINNIPSKISNMYTCGHWKYEGKTGFYRIIYIEFHYGCSLLYIQWMLDGEINDGNTKVLHTLSIKEFNANDHIEFTFQKPECKETKDGIKFNITANSGHDMKKHNIELNIFHKFGKYDFKERIEK